jgi:hypothetical protein
MSSENPYAPSHYPVERAQAEFPSTGVYRYRQYVVKHRDSPLPMRCVKTGVPTERTEKLKLQCSGKNDASIPARRRFLIFEHRYAVTVAVDEAWTRRRWPHVLARTVMLLGVAGFLVGVMIATTANQPSAGYSTGVIIAGGGAILFAFGWWLADWAMWRMTLIEIRREFLFLKGACRAYLDSLPLWPE